MTQAALKDSKEQIMAAFNRLLAEYKKGNSLIATKEEEAEKEKNKELLETVSNYTVENIVNGMASLQLNFGNIVNELSERLTEEYSKLDELKRGILVENQNLEQLRKVRLVADALYILRQENQEKSRILQNHTNEQRENIEKVRENTRRNWEKEEQEFQVKIVEEAALLIKQREQESADFQYTRERLRKIEMDEYVDKKRQQERELQELNRHKDKNWVEREKFLTDNQTQFQANQQKIAGFEEALKKAYNDAKGEAIKEAEREAKVKYDLFEKEWESVKQGYELKIQSLETTLVRQNEEIAALSSQLQTVTTQAQNLAMRAFQPSAQ